MKLSGNVSVTLKNGRTVSAHWVKDCRDVHIQSYDDEFFGTWSIDTTDYSAETDAKWCLVQLVQSMGGELA